MCKERAHAGALRGFHAGLILITALGVASGVNAQEPPLDLAELANRLDSLREASTRANRIADVADSVRQDQRLGPDTATDTVRVGPFMVVTPKSQARDTRRYFDRAWAPYSTVVGTEPTSIHGHVFTFQNKWPLQRLDIEGATPIDTRWAPGSTENFVSQRIGQRLRRDIGVEMEDWAGNFYLRMDPDQELEWTYRQLLTTRSLAVTGCYEGTPERCWDAMGLDHGDEWRVSWYSADDRVALVARLYLNRTATPQVLTCVEQRLDQTCLEILSQTGFINAIPLSAPARMTLLTHALSLGGSGAFQRLAGSGGSIRDRLAEAAGVPAETLITSWRDAVFAARPDVGDGGTPSRLTALAWLFVLAALSMRSTRWRLA